MDERKTARGRIAPSATCREPHDHARAVLAHFGEPVGIRGRRLVAVAYMDMHQRGTCLVCRVSGLDLLSGQHRKCRIVGESL